jgi:hypothetical protein
MQRKREKRKSEEEKEIPLALGFFFTPPARASLTNWAH